jgi:predicted DNA-binding protein YlxM (UPF0122 family)
MTKVLEASRRRLAGGASIPILAEAAEAQHWEGLADDEFDRYERKQRFVDHFAVSLTHRQAEVLGVVAEECQDHGHCALSISEIAEEAFVSHGTVYNALRVALELGLIEMREENVIRIIAPERQAVRGRRRGRRAGAMPEVTLEFLGTQMERLLGEFANMRVAITDLSAGQTVLDLPAQRIDDIA